MTLISKWFKYIWTMIAAGHINSDPPGFGQSVTLPGIDLNPMAPDLSYSQDTINAPAPAPSAVASPVISNTGTVNGTMVTDTTPAIQDPNFGPADENGFAVCIPLEAARQQAIADGFGAYANNPNDWPLKVLAVPVSQSIAPGELRIKAEWLINQVGTGRLGIFVSGSDIPPEKDVESGWALTTTIKDPALPDTAPAKYDFEKGAGLPGCLIFGKSYVTADQIVSWQMAKYLQHRNDPAPSTGPSAFIPH